MNTKRLISASIFALISASAAQAADVMVPHQPARNVQPAVVVPAFTWTGFYFGGQAGGFSSKTDMGFVGQDKTVPLSKDWAPKLSGFEGGLYTGANIDLGDNFIFSIDTDLNWAGQKHTKTIVLSGSDNASVDNAVTRSRRSARSLSGSSAGSTTPAPTVAMSTDKRVSAEAGTGTLLPAKPAVESAKSATAPAASAKPAGAQAAPVKAAGAQATPAKPATASAKPATAPAKPAGAQIAPVKAAGAQVAPVKAAGAQATPAKPVTAQAAAASAQTAATPAAAASAPALPAASAAPVSTGGVSSPEPGLKLSRSSVTSSGSAEHGANAARGVANGHNGASNGSGHSSHPHGANHGAGHGAGTSSHASNPHGAHNVAGRSAQGTQAADGNGTSVYGIEQVKNEIAGLGLNQEGNVETVSHTLKQNWAGATRVRIGFAADRIMPYIAGGIAYTQLQDTVSISFKKQREERISSKDLTDETKTMIGYTLGGGIDFAMTDNVLLRAEYRYSDFGKKKFAKEKLEINYKTNDFRVGVAYKF